MAVYTKIYFVSGRFESCISQTYYFVVNYGTYHTGIHLAAKTRVFSTYGVAL
jgi:hypothetical protein